MAVQLLGILRGGLLELVYHLVPALLLLGLLLLPGPLGLGVLLGSGQLGRGYRYRKYVLEQITKCQIKTLISSHPYPEYHLYVAKPSDSLRFEGEGDILVDHEAGGLKAGGLMARIRVIGGHGIGGPEAGGPWSGGLLRQTTLLLLMLDTTWTERACTNSLKVTTNKTLLFSQN